MSKAADEVHCFFCGTIIKKADSVCSTCGKNQGDRSTTAEAEVYCANCGAFIKREEPSCPSCNVSQIQTPAAAPAAAPAPAPVATPEANSESVSDQISCPKCGSTNVSVGKKGVDVKKAVVGVLLTGGLNLIADRHRAKQIEATCLKCGAKFSPEKG